MPGRADRLAARPVGRGEHVRVKHGQLRFLSICYRRLRRRRGDQRQAEGPTRPTPPPGKPTERPPRRPRWPPRPGWRNCWLTRPSRQPRRTARLHPPRPAEDHSLRQKLEAAETETQKAPRQAAHQRDSTQAATRAILHINRRCLQLTLRLLAANAEALPGPPPQRLPGRRRRGPGHPPGGMGRSSGVSAAPSPTRAGPSP